MHLFDSCRLSEKNTPVVGQYSRNVNFQLKSRNHHFLETIWIWRHHQTVLNPAKTTTQHFTPVRKFISNAETKGKQNLSKFQVLQSRNSVKANTYFIVEILVWLQQVVHLQSRVSFPGKWNPGNVQHPKLALHWLQNRSLWLFPLITAKKLCLRILQINITRAENHENTFHEVFSFSCVSLASGGE